jgi:hypothetical protein
MQPDERTPDYAVIGATLMYVAGLAMVGYAVWFVVLNFTHLIEFGLSSAEVGRAREETWAFSPGVYRYISHLQVNLGAFMVATGLADALMAWQGVRRRERWAWWGTVLTTVVWAIVRFPIHYLYGFGTLAHLSPAYLTRALFALGAIWLCQEGERYELRGRLPARPGPPSWWCSGAARARPPTPRYLLPSKPRSSGLSSVQWC